MQLQHGFSLLEVLITLLILKLGLLGVLAGQTLALQYVIDATQRTTAVALSAVLVQELAASISGQPGFSLELTTPDPIELPSCNAAAWCTGTELRDYQLARWQQLWPSALQAGLAAPLFAPQFCLQFTDNNLHIQASWQQRAHSSNIAQVAGCEAGLGRSALTLTARLP
ncbi:prepilin-type N-terminal cleavage/methylation domain-containing protein [Arsukibacterium ikkense]|nr:prepilin-type N-terminal cleavage/methylation domain-containing protein [Arsukibacterium ikkense]